MAAPALPQCPHLLRATATLRPPGPRDRVHKDECTRCFDSQDGERGVDVCLACFNGGCVPGDPDSLAHSLQHYSQHAHPFVLNIRRVPKEDTARPAKISKLAIEAESDEDKFDTFTQVRCYECGNVPVDPSPVERVVDGILKALSSKRQSDVKAWESEVVPCAHTKELAQGEKKTLESQELAGCNDCELRENLWLCLTCGNLGCGRQQFGGLGGNGHGIAHFERTGHPVSCKLGTITPEGTADVFCYLCGEERVDPFIATHLRHFGINIANQQKTVKSIAELELERNLKFDFSMTTEDGKLLTPLFGPGFTGIKNLGNTCYMASVLQVLFHQPEIIDRYLARGQAHMVECGLAPADCYLCQMAKLADGLCSGRYATPITDQDGEVTGQAGVAPNMFKALVGAGHPEFSSMRQQDAQEFYQHLLKTMQQREHAAGGADPTTSFQFALEQRLQCQQCRHVRYAAERGVSSLAVPVPAPYATARKPVAAAGSENADLASSTAEAGRPAPVEVDLQDCLAALFREDARSFACSVCKTNTVLKSTSKFLSLPTVLFIPVNRFVIGPNYVIEKLDAQVHAPLELDLESFRAGPHPEDELLFPEDGAEHQEATPGASGPAVDEAAVDQLMAMGFSRNRCLRALLATGNSGPDSAMNWIFEHMDDADIDDPVPVPTGGGGGGPTTASPEALQNLVDMGFTLDRAKKAMAKTNNDLERAVDYLFSHMDDPMDDDTADAAGAAAGADPAQPDTAPARYALAAFISHRGTSAHCGHYVAHVTSPAPTTAAAGGTWALFNDERVVEVPDVGAAIGEGYVYVYRRVAG